MNYKNVPCPYCGRPFTEDDDVVVCPDCGTPMHRACYQKNGGCVNEARHSTGFVWQKPYDPVEEAQKKREEEERKARQAAQQDEQSGDNPNKESPFGGYGEYGTGENGEFHPTYRIIGPDEKIGSFTAKEYSAVIQKNSQRYIPKFFAMEKTQRKTSWNWAAFFFPFLWMAYRKMYKYAILALLATVIIPICFMSKVYNYYITSYNSTQSYLMSSSDTDTDTTSEADDTASDTETVQEPTALLVNSYVSMAVQLMAAMFGNYLYRKKCDKVLKEASGKTGPPEQKAVYIAKKGGTSVWMCLLYLVIAYALFAAAVGVSVKTGSDLATLIWRLFHR